MRDSPVRINSDGKWYIDSSYINSSNTITSRQNDLLNSDTTTIRQDNLLNSNTVASQKDDLDQLIVDGQTVKVSNTQIFSDIGRICDQLVQSGLVQPSIIKIVGFKPTYHNHNLAYLSSRIKRFNVLEQKIEKTSNGYCVTNSRCPRKIDLLKYFESNIKNEKLSYQPTSFSDLSGIHHYATDLMIDPIVFDNKIIEQILKQFENMRQIDGITTAYTYAGSYQSIFGAHIEDCSLYSLSHLLFGKPKKWIGINRNDQDKFLDLCRSIIIII